MSYLVCEQCGKYYEINEGKESFSYDKCECGGKLTYTTDINGIESHEQLNNNSKILCSSCGMENPQNSLVCKNCGKTLEDRKENTKNGINWMGVALGLGFLLLSTLLTVFVIFGNNIPLKPEDIPYKYLVEFGIVAMVSSILSGMISAYVGGSTKFKEGIMNGGLVGVILGILVGITSGSITFLGVIAVFGSLSVIGGLIGTLLNRRRS
jgi:hypothetical protein